MNMSIIDIDMNKLITCTCSLWHNSMIIKCATKTIEHEKYLLALRTKLTK